MQLKHLLLILIIISLGCDSGTPPFVKRLEEAANKGNLVAQKDLGLVYLIGLGPSADIGRAANWYRKAAKQSDPQSQYVLGLLLEGIHHRFPKEPNNIFLRVYDSLTHHKEAPKWYRAAAEQGHTGAQVQLGNLYTIGKGVQRDEQEATKWMWKAAIGGNIIGRRNLSLMYSKGYAIAAENKEALERYRLNAARDAEAAYKLGVILVDGLGVAQDEEAALKWFQHAAELGHAAAQYELGVYHALKIFDNTRRESAVKWYTLAAQNGNPNAQLTLAETYVHSEKDVVLLLRLAANHGLEGAQFRLALLYEEGKGIPMNLKEAARLYWLAAEQETILVHRKD